MTREPTAPGGPELPPRGPGVERYPIGERSAPRPKRMTAEKLGHDVALLAWETFTDFLSHRNARALFGDIGLPERRNLASNASAEELLTFVLWAHTRGIDQAFAGRADPERIERARDALHDATCDALLDAGTPPPRLARFEETLRARYSEYEATSKVSDQELERCFTRHLAEGGGLPEDEVAPSAFSLARATIEIVEPLRGYLSEVELLD